MINEKEKRSSIHQEQSGPQQLLIKGSRHFPYFKKRKDLFQKYYFLKLADKTRGFLISEEKVSGILVNEISFLSHKNVTIQLTRYEAFILCRALDLHFKAFQPVFAKKDGKTYVPKLLLEEIESTEIKTTTDLACAVKEKILKMRIDEGIENELVMEILTNHGGDIEDKIDRLIVKPLEKEIEKTDEDKRPILIEEVVERLKGERIL